MTKEPRTQGYSRKGRARGPWSIQIVKNGGDWRYILRGAPTDHPTLGPWLAELNSHIVAEDGSSFMNHMALAPEMAALLEVFVIGVNHNWAGGDWTAVLEQAYSLQERLSGDAPVQTTVLVLQGDERRDA